MIVPSTLVAFFLQKKIFAQCIVYTFAIKNSLLMSIISSIFIIAAYGLIILVGGYNSYQTA